MKPVRCPCCGALLRALKNDPWEVVRTFTAVHLRSCEKAPKDEKKIRQMAVQVADEVERSRNADGDQGH